jgi:hypothetical protein
VIYGRDNIIDMAATPSYEHCIGSGEFQKHARGFIAHCCDISYMKCFAVFFGQRGGISPAFDGIYMAVISVKRHFNCHRACSRADIPTYVIRSQL